MKLREQIKRVFKVRPIDYKLVEHHKFDWHKKERDEQEQRFREASRAVRR